MQLRQDELGPEISYHTLHASNPAIEQGPPAGRRRGIFARGFTLVETMVATVLLSIMILSILQVMLGSYQIAAKARYNDHARYIIRSFADQFLTQSSTDAGGNTLNFFNPTSQTGVGLAWTVTSPTGIQTTYTGSTLISPTSGGLQVPLSDSTTGETPIKATISYTVSYLDPTTGATTLSPPSMAAGNLLEAVFTATYTFTGVTTNQSITAIRAVP
jgi:prepilin-type N-terminal cleavage/methylation domain-containing protein